MVKLFIATIFLFVGIDCCAQITGYSYGKEITILGSQVSGALNNFPVLLSFVDPDLRTTGNGGHVQNSSGWDIVFSAGCTTTLPHQIERYNATTGEFVVWVQVPTLNQNVNTSIYMYYGKSGVGADPSTDAVWDTNYVGVYHLTNNSFVDASAPGTGNNGTNSGTNDVASAKIAGGRNFDPTNEYIQLPTAGWSATSGTVSVWGISDAFTDNHQYFFGHTTQPSFANRIQIYTNDSGGNLDIGLGGNHNTATNIFDLNTGQWYYIVLTWNSGNFSAYVNNNLVTSGTYTALSTIHTLGDIGNQGNPATRNESFDGRLDEMRISNIARSSSWIFTEFRNQNNPSSFYNVSSEMTADATCALPIELSLFEAIPDKVKVKLFWTTASEKNNDFFTIERSGDAESWVEVITVRSTGNGNARRSYTEWDHSPLPGTSYYRLKQTDYDGTYSYSWIRKVDMAAAFNFRVYPNPSNGEFIIELSEPATANIKLFNSLGQPVPITSSQVNDSVIVNAQGSRNGIYYLQIDNGDEVYRQLIVIE